MKQAHRLATLMDNLARGRLLLLVLLVLLPPRAALAQLISPGPLARSHQKIDSEGSCGECHESGRKVVDARCLVCHRDVKGALGAGRGFHAQLIKKTGKDCASCHPDHQGRGFPLIRWNAQKLGFAHDQTGFPLTGAHAKLGKDEAGCKKCHKQGNSRFFASPACSSCHEDIHRPSLGKDCGKCHDDQKFRPAPRFDHGRARYKLEGKHAPVPCARCHPGEGEAQRWRGIAFGKCDDCHKDPHKGRNQPTACATCHDVRGWDRIKGDAVRENHAPGVFPLRGKHVAVACDRCHPKGKPMRGAPTRCEACHQSPHGHDLGARCAPCHSDRGWTVLVGKFQHERAGYPLLGRHAETACGKCHPAKGTFRERYLRPHDRCARCHTDPHRTTYRTVAAADRCEACHAEHDFAPSTFGVRRHVAPLFPVDGAHGAVACTTCHRAGDAPVASAARRAAAFRMHLEARDCVACHKNPHGDRFARETQSAGCKGCHTTSDWRVAKIDHDRTGFALRGRHAQVACSQCHTKPASTPQPERYRGAPRACDACHGDPHLGQFAATAPKKTCDACHGPERWKGVTFAHDRDAKMPLDGKHASVPCEKCHEKRRTARGEVVAYRHGRTECQACHDDHHGRGGDWKEGVR